MIYLILYNIGKYIYIYTHYTYSQSHDKQQSRKKHFFLDFKKSKIKLSEYNYIHTIFKLGNNNNILNPQSLKLIKKKNIKYNIN